MIFTNKFYIRDDTTHFQRLTIVALRYSEIPSLEYNVHFVIKRSCSSFQKGYNKWARFVAGRSDMYECKIGITWIRVSPIRREITKSARVRNVALYERHCSFQSTIHRKQFCLSCVTRVTRYVTMTRTWVNVVYIRLTNDQTTRNRE